MDMSDYRKMQVFWTSMVCLECEWDREIPGSHKRKECMWFFKGGNIQLDIILYLTMKTGFF